MKAANWKWSYRVRGLFWILRITMIDDVVFHQPVIFLVIIKLNTFDIGQAQP